MRHYAFSARLFREAPESAGAAPPESAPPAEAGPDLSFIPAEFVADGSPDLAKFSDHYREIAEKVSKYDERLAGVPEEYSFDLPADFSPGELPLPTDDQGNPISFAVDTQDEAVKPLLAEVSALLKDLGAPADASPKMMGLLARYEAIRESRKWQEFQTDVEALGGQEKFAQRFATVKQAVETKLSKEDAEALLQGNRVSAGAIRALEKLLAPRPMQPPTPQPQPVDPLAVRYPSLAKKG